MQKRFSGLKKIRATTLWLGGLLAAASLQSNAAQNVKLAWNASTNADVAGYKVYYGGIAGNYTNVLPVGNVTAATISNLTEGATYYFAATAYNSSGVESRFSNEAIYTVPLNLPPSLNLIGNMSVNENASAQTVALTGISPGGSSTLTVSAVSSNTKLMANPTVKYTSPNSTGTLSLTPVHNASGAVVITVTLNNHNASNNITVQTFSVAIVARQSPPKITKQPTNTVAVVGKTVTFAVNATTSVGTTLVYQWQYNSINLPMATNAVLTLNNVTPAAVGSYSVTVAGGGGQTNSYPAALTVFDTAAASLDSAVCSKGAYTFTVNGVPGYKYAVQATTNMVNWVSLQTNTAPFTFVDSNAGHFSQRFYRSVCLQ